MGDWNLTDFNSRLATKAYAHSYDYTARVGVSKATSAGKAGPSAPFYPPLAAVTISRDERQEKYHGPYRLAPENMGHLERYFREAPGARIEKLLKPLVFILAIIGCAFLLLVTVGLIRNWSAPASTPNAAANQHPGQIGILNPEWVRQKSYQRSQREWPPGYFSETVNDSNVIALPSKFIYVPPAKAQQLLAQLVDMGLLTVAGGQPDAAKDFAQLKKLGITTD